MSLVGTKVDLVPTLCVGTQTDLTYETALELKSKALPRSTWEREKKGLDVITKSAQQYLNQQYLKMCAYVSLLGTKSTKVFFSLRARKLGRR
jgi:hypothetical protein